MKSRLTTDDFLILLLLKTTEIETISYRNKIIPFIVSDYKQIFDLLITEKRFEYLFEDVINTNYKFDDVKFSKSLKTISLLNNCNFIYEPVSKVLLFNIGNDTLITWSRYANQTFHEYVLDDMYNVVHIMLQEHFYITNLEEVSNYKEVKTKKIN